MANTSNANHSEKPTSANSAYSARHCYETFKRILSDWLHIEVKHHDIDTQSKNSGTFSGVSVHPRRLTQFHGSELGLPRFGIVLLDNHHSVLTSDQLFDREAKSMNNEPIPMYNLLFIGLLETQYFSTTWSTVSNLSIKLRPIDMT